MTDLRDMVAELIWGMDPDSVETPFGRLSPYARDNILDTAGLILALPPIAAALAQAKAADEFNEKNA